MGITAVTLVLAGAVAVATRGTRGGGNPAAPSGEPVAAAVARLAGIPTADLVRRLATFGGQLGSPLSPVTEAPIVEAGKPEVLFIGAEYCPFCAAERWALVTALLRFGTFSGLHGLASSPTDVYPDTPTVSFHGAVYTSAYVAFVARETQTRDHAVLDVPTGSERELWLKHAQGSIPFLDFGGALVTEGASYSPQMFAGMTIDQVAAAVADGSTRIGAAVQTVAGYFTTTLCNLTGDRPANVCSAFRGLTAGRS